MIQTRLSSVQERAVAHLRDAGKIRPADLERLRARAEREGTDRGLAYLVVEERLASAAVLREALFEVTGIRPLDLDAVPPAGEAIRLLPPEVLRQLGALPVSLDGRSMQVAVSDLYDLEASQRIQALTGLDVQLNLADEHTLWRHIDEHAGARAPQASDSRDAAGLLREAASEIREQKAKIKLRRDIDVIVERSRVPKLVDEILREGVIRGASDIHVQFFPGYGWVRFRIDGSLVEWDHRLEPELEEDLLGRIKALASETMNTSNRRTPQDGRIRREINGRQVEFRVSTLPTVCGEKAVLRILDNTTQALEFGALGLEGRDLEKVRRAIGQSHGMVLLTGPTGSGKTTTLYTMLKAVSDPSRNVITVEDPVERQVEGIAQVQVRHAEDRDADMSYAVVLKSILRQDPNVIMVGEIRDRETAEIAVQASMTGHLVLSTVHTNDAPGTITRLLDMGLEPFKIVGAVSLVIAQRLVRRICKGCVREVAPEPEKVAAVGPEGRRLAGVRTYAGTGCTHCSGTGYRGRIGVYEIMEMDERIRPLVLQRKSEQEISAAARGAHLVTLRAAGVERVRQGITTIDEVLRET